jgi:hypothetical protein
MGGKGNFYYPIYIYDDTGVCALKLKLKKKEQFYKYKNRDRTKILQILYK